MANHAKVRTGKTLNPDDVNEIVQRINTEKLNGVFTLTHESNVPNGYGKHQWLLKYKDSKYINLIFWISDDIDYNNDDEILLSKQSCIEFRHGHSFYFMWWIEGVFRENLGKHYSAKMWDDGVGECCPANPDKYETFKAYITGEKMTKSDIKKSKKFNFGWQKKEIPEELISSLNLDFEI